MTLPTHVSSRVYRDLGLMAKDLLSRTDPESHQKVFFKEEGEHTELLAYLIDKGGDLIYYGRAQRMVFSNGALITFQCINKGENKPVNTICGVQLTTAIFLEPFMHEQDDIMYTTSRLRSPSQYPSELWLYMGR